VFVELNFGDFTFCVVEWVLMSCERCEQRGRKYGMLIIMMYFCKLL